MLGKYGETLVVDWGLAKVVGKQEIVSEESTLRPASASASAETIPGMAIGTPAFMSPEQAAGRLDQLGPASDVYSLGATLYALLTGKPPVEDKEIAEVLNKVQRGDFPRPRQHNPDIHRALEAICLQAMSLQRADRYASPRALADDLERWLADKPVRAWPEPWTVKTRRWVGQHRTLVTGAAAALLVGVVSLVIATVLLTEANDQLSAESDKVRTANENLAVESRNVQKANDKLAEERNNVREANTKLIALAATEKQARDRAEDALGLSRLRYYVSQISLAQQEWVARRTAEAQIHLKNTPPDLRGWEYDYLRGLLEKNQVILRGHTGWIEAVAFSADGKRLFSTASDNTVRVWDVDKGQESFVLNRNAKESLPGHTGRHKAAFSANGKRVVAVPQDGIVRLWNLDKGQDPIVLEDRVGVGRAPAISPDGKWVACAAVQGAVGKFQSVVLLWDFDKGQAPRVLNPPKDVVATTFSPDGKRLACASWDGTVRLWDVEKRQDPLLLEGGELLAKRGRAVTVKLKFSPDGKRLASTFRHDKASNGTIRLWDLGKAQEPLILEWQTRAMGLVFSPDGKRLAGASDDHTVRLWDVDKGQELIVLEGHTDSIASVAFSPDGKRLASASSDTTVRLWDLEQRAEPLVLQGHTWFITAVAFSPDGKRLASASYDKTVRLWDVEKEQKPLVFKASLKGGVPHAAFSPDGKRVATSWSSSTVDVWDMDKSGAPLVLMGHTKIVRAIAFSPDGNRLASSAEDSTIRLWNLEKGQKPMTLKSGGDFLVFSPDGKRLANTYGSLFLGPGRPPAGVLLWDMEKGQELLVFGHKSPRGGWSGIQSVAFHLDGKRMVYTGGNDCLLWDGDKGQEPFVFKGHTRAVHAVALSPDGKRLASASSDNTVRLWDVDKRQELLVLEGHTAGVWAVAFSPDGKRVASASHDKTVRLWDVDKGVETLLLKGHTGNVFAVAFSRDGTRLMSASRDGRVRVWEAPKAPIRPKPK